MNRRTVDLSINVIPKLDTLICSEQHSASHQRLRRHEASFLLYKDRYHRNNSYRFLRASYVSIRPKAPGLPD
jgi:hypothetical protein